MNNIGDPKLFKENKKHIETQKRELVNGFSEIIDFLLEESYAFGYVEGASDASINANLASIKAAAKVANLVSSHLNDKDKLAEMMNKALKEMGDSEDDEE